jgi:hypothetical protein
VAIVTATRVWVFFVGFVLAASLPNHQANAANGDEARAYLDKATAAFALSRYASAAENFEKAFELKPDPAVLYNAAQAHRLAGNKERALALYQSYLRTYGKKEKRAEIEARIEELKQAIEHDKAVATSPLTGTEPVGPGVVTTAPPPVAIAAPSPRDSPTPNAATLPSAPSPSPESGAPALVASGGAAKTAHESVVKKPWFWGGVGGVVIVAVVVSVLLLSGGSKDPMPSIGKANGN